VSLWISPAGALASGKPLEGHPEDSWTDAASAADIAELLDDLLAAVEASESVHGDDALRQPLLENSGSFQFSPAPREEYHVVWPLGGSPLDTSSPRCGLLTIQRKEILRMTCRASIARYSTACVLSNKPPCPRSRSLQVCKSSAVEKRHAYS
jgi:hypothetical protein